MHIRHFSLLKSSAKRDCFTLNHQQQLKEIFCSIFNVHLLVDLFSAPWETKLSYSVVCLESTETWIDPYGSQG